MKTQPMTALKAAIKKNKLKLRDFSISDYLKDESVLVHSTDSQSFKDSTVEARVMFYIELPDGTRLEHNEVHRFALSHSNR